MDMNFAELEKLLTVTEAAALYGVHPRVVRKAAKADPPTIPGRVKVLGKIGFNPELLKKPGEEGCWVPPEPGDRVVGVAREDGRKRYRIFLSDEEYAELSPKYDMLDPRIAAAARRKARKDAKAAAAGQAAVAGEPAGEPSVTVAEDPFADFDVAEE